MLRIRKVNPLDHNKSHFMEVFLVNKLFLRSLFTLILGLSIVSCSQNNLPNSSQLTTEQIRKSYELSELEKHPELKQVLELTGAKSIFDINPNDRFVVTNERVTLASEKSSVSTRFGGFLNGNVRIFGTVGAYVTGNGTTSVACFVGGAQAGVNVTMYGPNGQFASLGNIGYGTFNAQTSRDISVIDSGRGYYQLYGAHRGTCGAETSYYYTQTGYTK
jgi:hypothetical protein